MTTDRSLHIAGLRVTPLPVETAVSRFLGDARASRPRVYVFVNGQSALLRRNSAAYARALEHELVLGMVDGAAVELAGRMQGLHDLTRCPGPDFFATAARAANADLDTRFYFLGGGPGVADKLRAALVTANPNLSVVGASSPPFGEWDEDVSATLIADVKASGANALWLGVSAPKQEIWAVAHVRELGMPVACVGAAFDFLAGVKPRAPKWVRVARLEWLYRLFSEPGRLWYRYLVGNSVFIIDAIRLGKRSATEAE